LKTFQSAADAVTVATNSGSRRAAERSRPWANETGREGRNGEDVRMEFGRWKI